MSATIPCPVCRNHNARGARNCGYCHTRLPKTTLPAAPLVMRIGSTGGRLDEEPPILLPDGETTVLGRDHGPVGDYIRRRGVEHYQEVSSRHVSLQAEGRDVLITDLKSVNGTFIGATRLSANVESRYPAPVTVRLASLVWIRIAVEPRS